MDKNYLKIRLDRFESNRTLACDLYLHLPLNKKWIKIASANSILEPSDLEKLNQKNVGALYVATDNPNLDPDSFELYVTGAEAAQGAPDAQTPSDSPSESPTELTSKMAPPLATDALPPQEETSASIEVAASSTQPPTSTSIDSDGESPSNPIKVPSEATDEEEVILGATGISEDEGTSILSVPDIDEVVQTIKSSPSLEEAEEKFQADNEDSRPEQRFSASKNKKEEEASFSQDEEGPETINRVRGEKQTEDKTEQRFSKNEKKKEEPVFTIAASKEEEETVVFRLNRRIETEKESMISGRGSLLQEQRNEVLQEVRYSLMTEKISDEITTVAGRLSTATLPDQPKLEDNLRQLETAFRDVTTGKMDLEEIEKRFPVEKELKEFEQILSANDNSEKLIELSERLSSVVEKQEHARRLLAPDATLKRAKHHRDLGSTVCRLAAYLGHSIGYVREDFLTDLSATAALYFAKKEGNTINEEAMPALAKALFSDQPTQNAAVEDAKEIIQILEAYVRDPDCDRGQLDFEKKIFDRTLKSLTKAETFPSALNLARWSQFVELGPNLDCHTVCSRAAGHGTRLSKASLS